MEKDRSRTHIIMKEQEDRESSIEAYCTLEVFVSTDERIDLHLSTSAN